MTRRRFFTREGEGATDCSDKFQKVRLKMKIVLLCKASGGLVVCDDLKIKYHLLINKYKLLQQYSQHFLEST